MTGRDVIHEGAVGKSWGLLVDEAWVDALIETAKQEDMGRGDASADVTSELFLGAEQKATAGVVARGDGVMCGMRVIERVCGAYDGAMRVNLMCGDGEKLEAGQTVARISGGLRSMLAAERVLLNFVSYLSGIATATHGYVERVAGTGAKIYDTRKTLPGYRGLSKYAVRCGGGRCHRIGLHDAVLVKDNHIAGLGGKELAEALRRGVEKAAGLERRPDFIEVEVDTIEQLEVVLGVEGVGIVLLDNMGLELLSEAVAMRAALAKDVKLEASGGVNLETVRGMAETGVDRISVGALTHSVVALDLGLDIEAR